MNFTRRKVIGAAGAAAVTAALPGRRAFAQGSGPVKIGMSMPQTGSLGAGGQAALVAIRAGADNDFAQNLANGARELAKKAGIQSVYDQNYPPTTTDFSSLVRGIRAAKPDIVFVMSYPNGSVAIVRAVNEIGVGSGVKLFGGGMVGLQFTPIMSSLGSALNGITNYNSYVPGIKYPGIEDFLQRYAKRAAEAKVDPLGFYLPPFNYAIGQILEQAVNATKTLDQKKLAAWLHGNEVKTIVRAIRWDKHGEWANPRVVQAQFRGVTDKDLEQFRKPGKQVVIYPDEYKTGDVIAPFEKARQAKA